MKTDYKYMNGKWYLILDLYYPKTIEDYEQLHRKYWELITIHKIDYKPSILVFDGLSFKSIHIPGSCFACAYTEKMYRRIRCDKCPIREFREYACINQSKLIPCLDKMDNPYRHWIDSTYYSIDGEDVSKQISELKFTDPEPQ